MANTRGWGAPQTNLPLPLHPEPRTRPTLSLRLFALQQRTTYANMKRHQPEIVDHDHALSGLLLAASPMLYCNHELLPHAEGYEWVHDQPIRIRHHSLGGFCIPKYLRRQTVIVHRRILARRDTSVRGLRALCARCLRSQLSCVGFGHLQRHLSMRFGLVDRVCDDRLLLSRQGLRHRTIQLWLFLLQFYRHTRLVTRSLETIRLQYALTHEGHTE